MRLLFAATSAVIALGGASHAQQSPSAPVSDQDYMKRVMLAAPPQILADATIVRMKDGGMQTLKKGSSQWTCMENNGVPYCKPHYYQLFAPKCYACRQPILDVSDSRLNIVIIESHLLVPYILQKVTTALGQKWHPDCFKCVQCHHPLMKDGFREKDSKAYCLNCYHGLFSPKCAACNAPIEDVSVSYC